MLVVMSWLVLAKFRHLLTIPQLPCSVKHLPGLLFSVKILCWFLRPTLWSSVIAVLFALDAGDAHAHRDVLSRLTSPCKLDYIALAAPVILSPSHLRVG
ncbi:hypothetical protein GE09DRAFT_175648 [Coniochaeta sp. 2T2.1]|nr:hypothetical protein GE09DRAFT_175648 [Coniochaeta sp. 2T2.1]